MGGLGLTIRGLVVLVEELSLFPVVTTSKLVPHQSVTFPAITLCNLNRVNCVDSVFYMFDYLNETGRLEAWTRGEEVTFDQTLLQLWKLNQASGCFVAVSNGVCSKSF